jgi:hypothetical protein
MFDLTFDIHETSAGITSSYPHRDGRYLSHVPKSSAVILGLDPRIHSLTRKRFKT